MQNEKQAMQNAKRVGGKPSTLRVRRSTSSFGRRAAGSTLGVM
jgi:hypothetical protein